MNTRNTPRWANLAYGIIAFAILAAFLVNGYIHGYDFTQMLGYFWANFGDIFALLILVGLALNGVVAVFNLLSRRTHLPKPGRTATRYITVIALGGVLNLVAMWFALVWHPLGYLWSIIVAIAILVSISIAMSRLVRGVSEGSLIELQDKVMKGTDDPNEPARWVP